MEWREILNEKQRTKHDRDLQAIDKTFKNFNERLTRWSKGDVQPTDLPTAVSDQPRSIMNPEDAWQYYVRMFIVDYNLDESQQVTAHSVLNELRKEAAAYRQGHKDEFAELDAKYQELTQSDPKTDPVELAEARKKREVLDQKRQRLEGAISVGMFNRLKKKLLTIPRSDQRQTYEARKARLNKVAKVARAEFEARISSQPASSQPVKPTAARNKARKVSRGPKPAKNK